MGGLLADEAGHLTLQGRVVDLVAEVPHRTHKEVFAIGEDGRQSRRQVASDEVTVGGKMPGDILQRFLEGHPPSRDLAIRVACLRHGASPPSGLISHTLEYLSDFLKYSFLVIWEHMEQALDQSAETKGAQTRRAILDAAIARFGRDGFRSTSVADIARDASVGGTVAYAYFPSKEALFLAAVDLKTPPGSSKRVCCRSWAIRNIRNWRDTLIFVHWWEPSRAIPLARRLLAGLEPEVTVRVLEIPALSELRKACTERLRSEQAAGTVRPDIDPVAISNGVVALMLSMLMSVVQLGSQAAVAYSSDVATVFGGCALGPTPSHCPTCSGSGGSSISP